MEAHLKALALVSIAVVIVLAALILLISISDGKADQVSYKHMDGCYQRLSPVDIVCNQPKRDSNAPAKDL
jgi:hypothetical protein